MTTILTLPHSYQQMNSIIQNIRFKHAHIAGYTQHACLQFINIMYISSTKEKNSAEFSLSWVTVSAGVNMLSALYVLFLKKSMLLCQLGMKIVLPKAKS